jgi:hypothetical protein
VGSEIREPRRIERPLPQETKMSQPRVFEIQIPLRQRYQAEPKAALVIDRARALGNDSDDPFHSIVMPMPECGIAVPVGVHRAVGGLHDAPTPGDLLCAALAACQDSSVRMVANILGITLDSLEVEVTGDVDVRGTLAMNAEVPGDPMCDPAQGQGGHGCSAAGKTPDCFGAKLCRAADAPSSPAG